MQKSAKIDLTPSPSRPASARETKQSLRRLLSEFDSAQYVIHGSFAHFDPELEQMAVGLRKHIQESIYVTERFLETFEKHPQIQPEILKAARSGRE